MPVTDIDRTKQSAAQTYYDKQVASEAWPAPSEIGADYDFRDIITAIFSQANAAIAAMGDDSRPFPAMTSSSRGSNMRIILF